MVFGIFALALYVFYFDSFAKNMVETYWKYKINKDHIFNDTTWLPKRNKVSQNMTNFETATYIHDQNAHLRQNCTLWKIPSNLAISRDPQIKLNPNLFLYPGMTGGPNNQIKGFYQSIYLAIQLNR